MSQHFEVEYTYYQHNSGAADNGEYTRTVKKPTLGEATELARRINEDATHYKNKNYDKRDEALADELIPYSGFFIGSKVYECQRTEVEGSKT